MQAKPFYKEKEFYPAVAILVGTTIGVGIFALPYAIARSGLLIGLIEILAVGLAVLLVQLFYAEVIMRTKERHRIVGYADKYLGKKGKILASFGILVGYSGNLLAYLVVGGTFLDALFGRWLPLGPFWYSILLFAFGAAFVYMGLKLVAKGELFMTGLLLVTVVAIVAKCSSYVEPANLVHFDFSQSFLAYGVILFSLGAASAIPELISLLKGKRHLVKSAIVTGSAIPIIIYMFFAAAVVGVTGLGTTPEAIAGLDQAFGNGVTTLGMIFGFLAVTTSFLVIGLNLKENLWYDYKLPHALAWAIALGIPLALFLLGANDFITIASVAGGISGGLIGMVMVLTYWRAKKKGNREPEFSLKFPRWVSYIVGGAFLLGALYEVIFQLFLH